MPSERVHAWLAVHGVEMRVRFDDEHAFTGFKSLVERGYGGLQLVFLKNGQRAYVRPSTVDALSRDGER